MNRLLMVGAGGFVGAVLRSSLGSWVQTQSHSVAFPYGTLAVNLIGCAAMGLLSHLAESRGVLSQETRQFLMVGMLGAFTTFSTFSSETMGLLQKGDDLRGLLNVTLHLMLGLAMIWAGRTAGRRLWE